MKIIDQNGNAIENPDLSLGYLKTETQTIHHPAVEGVEEIWHYEYKEYPNGGRDAIRIVDTPGVPAREAYDEIVEIQRYILYTADELQAIEETKRQEEEAAKAEAEKQAAIAALPDVVAALEEKVAMTDYTAILNTLLGVTE